MPLFHIHGLVAALLASLQAGASVACTPGFLAPEFFKWLDWLKPTWYTAVPTMHQAILARAEKNMEVAQAARLRFIRSSSASLPPSVMAELETVFQAPVIEAYGMTEASHQMTSNPLPPAVRKPGSVGRPAGPEVAIMAADGPQFLPAGTRGEIVIRGDNVTLGYANNPEANQKSFVNGWFRTGDQGFKDSDGYLFITGRLKELINRGGEKISPREIDEIFLEHPAVAQAVAFGVPDKKLGEDLALAVVLKDTSVTAKDLQAYAGDRLALHKVPQQIIILTEIPKGPTGKIQRIGLAEKLGLTEQPDQPSKPDSTHFIAPATPLQETITSVWQKVLDVPAVGIQDRFIDLGGDSMLATVVHMLLEEAFSIKIPLVELYGAATVADQATLIERLKSSQADRS